MGLIQSLFKALMVGLMVLFGFGYMVQSHPRFMEGMVWVACFFTFGCIFVGCVRLAYRPPR